MVDELGRPLDRPEESRFVIEVGDQVAELVYRRVGQRLVLEHTGVPDALGGRGLAGRLVQAAVGRAAAEGLTVVPICPYVAHWLREHPDEAASVRIDW